MSIKRDIMQGQNFIAREMPGASFSNCRYQDCCFEYADLRHTSFSNCVFQNCSFNGADLQESTFTGIFADVSMRDATLDGANFRGIKRATNLCCAGASMQGVKLNLEVKALVSEYFVFKAKEAGGPEEDERVAWALFIARDERYCREFFKPGIFPTHIRKWGAELLLNDATSHLICQDSKCHLINSIAS